MSESTKIVLICSFWSLLLGASSGALVKLSNHTWSQAGIVAIVSFWMAFGCFIFAAADERGKKEEGEHEQ